MGETEEWERLRRGRDGGEGERERDGVKFLLIDLPSANE